ncbi:hypothetical protein GCM10009836_02160 [Pseudonocardia ailaonensis]|uniref:HTH tetR-type domain-containing protein n=1 Tax=Pseudonocardia ailaonensis TaxID=367279 RepID=A0ABN2MIT9_9PSEU
MTTSRRPAGQPSRRGPGRPPDADGEETRREIQRVARGLFATHGYAGTTTRMIADEVGVTTAALHHYFGRKTNLVLALWWSTTDTEYLRLTEAIDAVDSFAGKVAALLDATVASIRADPESTRFIVSIREDARRTPELAEIVADNRLAALIRGLVGRGVAEGVVDEATAPAVRGTLAALLLGITTMSTDLSVERIDQMTRGSRRLLDGTLFQLRPGVTAHQR